MIATLAFVFALAPESKVTCPVMPGDAVGATSTLMEYKGIGFLMCCAGCDKSFAKDPGKFLAKGDKSKLPIGYTMFDPVTGKALNALNAKTTLASKGILYGFASPANQKAFKANPAKFAAPAKESLKDPISGKAIAKYSKAAGYVDYSGVRFYAESTANYAKMKANPAKLLKAKLSTATVPAVIAPAVK